MNTHLHTGVRSASALALSLIVCMLAACGGNEAPEAKAGEPIAESQVGQAASDQHSMQDRLRLAAQGGSGPGPASASEQAASVRGAQLNQAALEQAEQQALAPGAATPKSAYLSGEVARKAAAVRIPAYRFYNGSTGAHFYTVSETERATVASTLSPPFSFDGPAFSVASDHSAGLASVHRFYNTRTGVHFYTISETERANVVATLPHFAYEGVAYYASQVAGAGLVPLYRFYVPSRGFHFYTASAAEKANIEATLGHIYTYEGIGYHVLDTGWAARQRVPHTGITTSQCYQAGSDTLVACGGSGATALNPQQDGHRAGIAPMSYSTEPSLFGPYPISSCVRDNVTGLVWEGKTPAGERAGSNSYTNLGNNAATDTSGYVAAVNAMALCGYTDWRLPTRQELVTLLDYSGLYSSLKINAAWFPNTSPSPYWTGVGLSTDASRAWHVMWNSGGGFSFDQPRNVSYMVRLVRGAEPAGQRYSYSTLTYGSDAANNVVNDAWTGLQWRRCEQGRVWSGSGCAGTATAFDHEQALAHARTQAGWRLPNVKELASLVDLSVTSGARIDRTAFPGAAVSDMWSTTPSQTYPTYGLAFYVEFGIGQVGDWGRNAVLGARLVRTSP